jgi:hypothetical protein
MGGHGALVCALRNPDLFRSVSALAFYLRPPRVYPGARRPSSATSGEQGDLEGQRRERTGRRPSLPRRAECTRGPGPRRPVSGGAATSAIPGGSPRRGGATVDSQPPGGLGPLLLHDLHLHGEPNPPPRRGPEPGPNAASAAVIVRRFPESRSALHAFGPRSPARRRTGPRLLCTVR